MNKIKGLLTKDLLQVKSYKRTLIIFIIVFIGCSMIQEHTRNVITVMMTLGISIVGVATLSYDEMAKADRYLLTLPLTRKQVILSKYILVISLTIIGAILGILVSTILALAIDKQLPDFQELLVLGTGAILGTGILECIKIPCIYKYGIEKGRIQVFIIMGVLATLIGGIGWLGKILNISLPTDYSINMVSNLLPIILMIAAIVVYGISYKISYNIYNKKEM